MLHENLCRQHLQHLRPSGVAGHSLTSRPLARRQLISPTPRLSSNADLEQPVLG